MEITDRDRTELHNKLGSTLGAKDADTLMALLSPVPWQQMATKDDLRVLASELRGEMEQLRGELSGEMHRGFAQQTRWLVGSMMAWTSLLLAAAALIF